MVKTSQFITMCKKLLQWLRGLSELQCSEPGWLVRLCAGTSTCDRNLMRFYCIFRCYGQVYRQKITGTNLTYTTVFYCCASGYMNCCTWNTIRITRNVWQSLAYSQLGVIVSCPSEYLWNAPNYWSLQCLTAPGDCAYREEMVGKRDEGSSPVA